MKKIVSLIICFVMMFGTIAFAATSTAQNENPVISYAMGLAATNLTGNLNGAALDNATFCTITLSAGNDEDGFKIVISGDGILTHDGDGGGVTVGNGVGHNISYLVDIGVASGSYFTSSAKADVNPADSNAANRTNNYTDPQRAATNETINLGMTTSATATLISGTYTDVLTVTIADL